jgi:hypothetical protein
MTGRLAFDILRFMVHWRHKASSLLLQLVALALVATLLGCGIQSERYPEQYTVELVDPTVIPNPPNQPPGEYLHLAWLGGWIYVQYDDTQLGRENGYAYASRIWKLRPDGSDWQQVDLTEGTSSCFKTAFWEPTHLPNGELGYILICQPDPERFTNNLLMMSYNPITGKSEQLLSYPLPAQASRRGIYSWSNDMTTGIMDDRDGVGERLLWLMTDKWKYLDLSFDEALSPVWSPDNKWIAFWGAPEQGLRGIDKAKAIFNLYLLAPDDPDTTKLVTQVQGFRYVLSLAWSPDSKWLLFTGTSAKGNEEGIWLTDIAEKKLYLVARGSFTHLTWTDDKNSFVAIKAENDKSALLQFSVQRLLEQSASQSP